MAFFSPGLDSIEKLSVSDNLISELRADMWEGLGSLKKMYLQWNRLKRCVSQKLEQGNKVCAIRVCPETSNRWG